MLLAVAAGAIHLIVKAIRSKSPDLDRRIAPWVGVGESGPLGYVSTLAEPRTIGAASVALAMLPGGKLPAVGTAVAGAVGHVLKLRLPRERPNKTRFSRLGDQSFPSTHTALATALALGLAANVRPSGLRLVAYVGAAAAAFTVGFSRLRLCAHWPTDVIGGLAVGLFGHALATLAIAPTERC